MTNETNSKRQPTHLIWQVIGENDKARWIRVGAAWTHKDGKGLMLKFDAYPVVGHIAIREISEQVKSAEGGRGQ